MQQHVRRGGCWLHCVMALKGWSMLQTLAQSLDEATRPSDPYFNKLVRNTSLGLEFE